MHPIQPLIDKLREQGVAWDEYELAAMERTFNGREEVPFGAARSVDFLLATPTNASFVLSTEGMVSQGQFCDIDSGISPETLVDWVTKEVRARQHDAASSIHLLLALFEQDLRVSAEIEQRLRVLYRTQHPDGGPFFAAELENARKSNQKVLVTIYESLIERTPFHRKGLIERMRGYLASPFYPFGRSRLREFIDTIQDRTSPKFAKSLDPQFFAARDCLAHFVFDDE